MAEESKTNYIESLKDDIKKNERIQNELKEEVRKLKEKLKDHDESCQTKINDLEEKIKTLKEENNTLQENIKELERKTGDLEESKKVLEKQMKEIDDNAKKEANEAKTEIKELKKKIEGLQNSHEKEANEAKTEIGELKTELGKLHEKINKFELSEEELVIRQLCSSVQENLLKIVLQEYFDKFQNKRTQHMENYILWQIEDKDEQDKARLRWKDIKKATKWDEYLLKQLKSIKMGGNETAHPSLTEEIIDAAKMNLKEKGKLGKHMGMAVDQLKAILKQTNRKLLQGSSSKGQEQGGPSVVSTTTQRPPTGSYASKAAGGLVDCFGPKQAIQSLPRSAFQKRHYSGAC